MSTKLRYGVLAGIAAIGITLSGGTAANAATTAETGLTGTATKLTYGQPDLNGRRSGSNVITITNNTGATIEYPSLTFDTTRDIVVHGDMSGCASGRGSLSSFTCVAYPLAAGETRALTVPWWSNVNGPGGTAAAILAEASDREGTPIDGTESTLTWKVKFEKLTGTFSVSATTLAFSEPDAAGVQTGSTKVTIKNLSSDTVQYPVVTFPLYNGDAVAADWTGCVRTFVTDNVTGCVAKPLAPGAKRTVEFPFSSAWSVFDFESYVWVAVGADAEGTVVTGTTAGATYLISSPTDD